jgi:hypothetical protein
MEGEPEQPPAEHLNFIDRYMSKRVQAIALINIFAISSTIYQSIVKVATNEYDVDVWDMSLVRLFIGIFIP